MSDIIRTTARNRELKLRRVGLTPDLVWERLWLEYCEARPSIETASDAIEWVARAFQRIERDAFLAETVAADGD